MTNLPEIELFVNSSGITIFCPCLSMPRFIPFDNKGRCNVCHGNSVEVDYILQPEGITIFCSRLKEEKFVPFDKRAAISDNSVYKLRTRNKVYSIPMRRKLICTDERQETRLKPIKEEVEEPDKDESNKKLGGEKENLAISHQGPAT